MSRFAGSIVVVTGAAAGIGRALAIEAAARGGNVVAIDIDDTSDTVDTIRSAGGTARGATCDVRDEVTMGRLGHDVCGEDRPVGIVCANAGVGVGGTVADTPIDEVRRVLDINVMGVFNTVQAFLPGLRRGRTAGNPAAVLITGSEHSLGVPPHVPAMTAYTTSKHALLGMAACMRRDLASDDIGVSLLCPGYVRTERVRAHAEASAAFADVIAQYGQDADMVASLAFNGVERGAFLIPTNPASHEFAVAFHRELIGAIATVAPCRHADGSA